MLKHSISFFAALLILFSNCSIINQTQEEKWTRLQSIRTKKGLNENDIYIINHNASLINLKSHHFCEGDSFTQLVYLYSFNKPLKISGFNPQGSNLEILKEDGSLLDSTDVLLIEKEKLLPLKIRVNHNAQKAPLTIPFDIYHTPDNEDQLFFESAFTSNVKGKYNSWKNVQVSLKVINNSLGYLYNDSLEMVILKRSDCTNKKGLNLTLKGPFKGDICNSIKVTLSNKDKKIFEENIVNYESINLDSLENGVYNLQIEYSGESPLTFKDYKILIKD